MNRTKSTFFGVISSQAFMIISMALNIFSTPFIVKGLDAQIYGLSIIIFQITSYLGQFDFGLGAGVTRYLAGNRGTDDESKSSIEKIISTSFIVYLILGSLVAMAGVAAAPFAIKIFNVPTKYASDVQPIISIVCVLVGFQFLLRSISGIFYAHQRQVLSNTISFVLTITNTVFVIVFIYMGYGLWSFVYAQIIGFIFNVLINLFFFKKYYRSIVISVKDFDSKLLRQMFSFGFYIFLNGLAVQIVFQTDRIIVGSLISLTAVSIYSLTTRIPELMTGIIWKITENSFPGMVELSKSNESKTFKETHDKLMQLTLSLSTIGFWVILIISFPFLKLWVGEKYYAGIVFISLVSGLYLFQHTFLHVTAVCLNGAGFVKGFSLMSIVEASLNLLLSILFCKKYGLIGVVIGTVIAGFLTSVWFVPFVAIKYKGFKLYSYLLSIFKPIFICSIFGGLSFFLFGDFFKTVNSWFKLFYCSSGLAIILLLPFIWLNRNLLGGLKRKIFQ